MNVYPEHAAIFAPVAGHTDLPTRLSARRHGCKYAFTEMVDAGSLAYNIKKTMTLIARDPSEDFLGVQIVGSDPDTLMKAVDILNTRQFDVLDFNLGCPAPKVAKKGEGITLALKNPDEAVRLTEMLVKRSRIPVSVKTRIQSETDPEQTLRFCKRLEETGISALTLHGRVMKVFYSGPVFHEIIRLVRENLKIQVIANGGAMDGSSYRNLLEQSHCGCGMIARGALGNPWIFNAAEGNAEAGVPTVKEFVEEIDRHIHAMLSFYGIDLGLRVCRKTILEYVHGRGFPSALRASVSFLKSKEGFDMLLMELRRGPSERYWEFLELHPEQVERKLRK